MRQIKFRVFDKNDGMFLVDGLVGTSKGMRVSSVLQIPEDCDPECYTLEPWEWEYSDDDVLMQYTGLKDKNGVEIYEGDVLKISNISVLRCEFRNGCFVLVHSKEFAGVENLLWGNLGRLYDAGMNDIFELTEVIGNIYQNPELLESK